MHYTYFDICIFEIAIDKTPIAKQLKLLSNVSGNKKLNL